ncbi:MAG TPA: carbonic anhydrase family protein [Stellaceae bacterium]|nr:carbonic anhydrase family protein [Stellaceae bacterium]
MVDRRAVLIGLLSCPVCASLARAADEAHWSYEGTDGPTQWGELDPGFKACSAGTQQSPIDLKGAIKADFGHLELDWKPQAYAIVNNGHTIQANAKPGSFARVAGETYALQQFHFHAPSEHAINGTRTAMEVHFVHAGTGGRYAVVGAFMQSGAANAAFGAIMAAAPRKPGDGALRRPIDPHQLVPAKSDVYRYAGSLTTPPCSEVVDWNVYAHPIEVAAGDIAAFHALYPMNARPLQALDRRFVLIGH